ncbi:hypothetical protein G7046_g1747 [Stylonectria norvegica]|nr:hypothetical protein G7046_g1747 [Stylonectria norvegica]
MYSVAKLLTRRSLILLLVSGVFLGALAVASRRLAETCEDGSYCQSLNNFSYKFPKLKFQKDDPNRIVPPRAYDPTCSGFPDTSNVLLVLKTGAFESSKIPTRLLTTLKCVPEFLIFGDTEQNIAGFPVRDALDDVLPGVQANNPDFSLYRDQKDCPVDVETCNEFYGDTFAGGVAMNKYKNIHIAEKAYKLRPEYDWYLFVEIDTYVVWPTLAEWLKRLDAAKNFYLGSAATVEELPFAQGGSGYVVSQATMKALFEGKTNVANRWDGSIRGHWGGDVLFSTVLAEAANTTLGNVWPTINDVKPNQLAFGPDQWCQPIATMNHLGNHDFSTLHAFEQTRGLSTVMRFQDIYFHMFEPHMQAERADWDNLSEDAYYLDPKADHAKSEIALAKTEGLSPLEQKAHLSFEACRKACFSQDDCLQFRYRYNVCATSRSFTFGKPMKPAPRMGDKWMSGWSVDRIDVWVRDNEVCPEVVWPGEILDTPESR